MQNSNMQTQSFLHFFALPLFHVHNLCSRCMHSLHVGAYSFTCYIYIFWIWMMSSLWLTQQPIITPLPKLNLVLKVDIQKHLLQLSYSLPCGFFRLKLLPVYEIFFNDATTLLNLSDVWNFFDTSSTTLSLVKGNSSGCGEVVLQSSWYGFSRKTWKFGWIHTTKGSSNLYATGPIFLGQNKALRNSWPIFDGFFWKLYASCKDGVSAVPYRWQQMREPFVSSQWVVLHLSRSSSSVTNYWLALLTADKPAW